MINKTRRRHLTRTTAHTKTWKAEAPSTRSRKTSGKQTNSTKKTIKSSKVEAKTKTKQVKRVPKKIGKKPLQSFKCSKCDNSFSLRGQLISHIRQQHPKKTNQAKKNESLEEITPAVSSLNTEMINNEQNVIDLCDVSQSNDFGDDLPTGLFTLIEVKEEVGDVQSDSEINVEDKEIKLEDVTRDEDDDTIISVTEIKEKPVNLTSCKYCDRMFRHKKNIRPHMNKKHPEQVVILIPDTSEYFACELCERKFKYKKNLNAHIRLKHPEVLANSDRDDKRPFQCHLCERRLKYKRNLSAHIRNKHFVPGESDDSVHGDYICNSCERRFLHRKNLLVHIRSKHPEEIDQPPIHTCNVCQETFRTISSLRKHKTTKHRVQGPALAFPKKCPLCEFYTSQKLPILRHFSEIHNIEVETTNIEFEEMQSFLNWKEVLEKETSCKYSKISTGKFEDHTTLIYQCYRSGRSRRSKNLEIPNARNSISIKMNAYCPAQLYVVDYYTIIKVRYTSTHVGHENELLKRSTIGTPKNRLLFRNIENVVQEIPAELANYNDSKGYEESKQIFIRISSKSKIDENTPTFTIRSVDDWVKLHKADILFHKKAGELSLLDLSVNELILVIMSKEQQSTMRKYGNKFICVHTVCNSQKYAFLWTTIMVLDNHNEGIPVAFLISNRVTSTIYQIFFQCVAEAAGMIQTEIFMGDRNAEMGMYTSWADNMGPAEQFLFCPWQVLEDWKMNSFKISDETKRKSVLNLLKNVFVEEKHETFEDELNSFVECTDPDIEMFRDYFIQNYIETIPSWAYCYRLDFGVEGKLTLADFEKVFSSAEDSKKAWNVISVQEALLLLDEYYASKRKPKDGTAVKIVGLDSLISIIEDNHNRALEVGYNAYEVIETDDGWLLMPPHTTDSALIEEVYNVRKNKIIPCSNCKLICPSCEVCFHRYSCSCTDNKNKLTMCDHVHFICNMLKKKTM